VGRNTGTHKHRDTTAVLSEEKQGQIMVAWRVGPKWGSMLKCWNNLDRHRDKSNENHEILKPVISTSINACKSPPALPIIVTVQQLGQIRANVGKIMTFNEETLSRSWIILWQTDRQAKLVSTCSGIRILSWWFRVSLKNCPLISGKRSGFMLYLWSYLQVKPRPWMTFPNVLQ
jgi:hypothetical protein